MKGAILIFLLGSGLISTQVLASGNAAAERLYKRLDTDNNGTVSEQEYVASAEQRARRAFKRLDSNGDGQLSEQEYDAAIQKMKQFFEQRRQQRLSPDNTNK
ncbi:MAG: hypothetical protein P8124_10615 [Gammaproteobacteria bacterium]|jgi:hypothetical protein